MAFTIEMTLPGVLRAGKWATEEWLNNNGKDDKRNAVIVNMGKTSTEDGGHYQAMDDDTLVGKAAIVIFLLEGGFRDPNSIKTNDAQHRNALNVLNGHHYDGNGSDVQMWSDQKAVTYALGWFADSETIAAVLDFNWDIDQAKIVGAAPDVIISQEYQNESGSVLPDKFVYSKTYTNKSTFSHDHGFAVKMGVKLEFEAQIPFVGKTASTVTIAGSQQNKWSFGEENTTTQHYEDSTDMKVPPHTFLKRTASVTSAKLNVPYTAKVRLVNGLERSIKGVWNGVTTFNLLVEQEDLVTKHITKIKS